MPSLVQRIGDLITAIKSSFNALSGRVSSIESAGGPLKRNNNLNDIANAATARINLGLQSGSTAVTNLGFSNAATINASVGAIANELVIRDAQGDLNARYLQGSHVKITHGSSTRSSDTVFYSSTDNFIRKNNADGFRNALDVHSKSESDARYLQSVGNIDASQVTSGTLNSARLSGTYNISISGNANTLDNINSTQFVRSDTNDVINAHLNIASSSSDEQLRIGQNRSGNPYMAMYIGTARQGFMQIRSDRLRLVTETGSTDRALDLLDDGRLFWNGSQMQPFSFYTGSSSSNTNYPVGSYVCAFTQNAGVARNVSLQLRLNGNTFDTRSGQGTTPLAGVWRARGVSDNGQSTFKAQLFQRVS